MLNNIYRQNQVELLWKRTWVVNVALLKESFRLSSRCDFNRVMGDVYSA
jgi:hypothetical protein